MVPAAAAAALLLCALAPGRLGFAIGVLAMELASCFVLYSTAFCRARPVRRPQCPAQHHAPDPDRRLRLDPVLAADRDAARASQLAGGSCRLRRTQSVCLPANTPLARAVLGTVSATGNDADKVVENQDPEDTATRRPAGWSPVFLLMLAGFAIEGFVLSAVLVQMVPLLTAVGLGASSVFIGTLFGPSQVASRLINMVFGSGLRQTWLALGATGSLAAGLAVLLLTTPSLPGAVTFAILFGLGSGLMSIVGGTLPLELFGRDGYGRRVGWITAARQFSAAFAPFGFALMAAGLGVFPALWVNAAVGLLGIAAFAAIASLQARTCRLAHACETDTAFGVETTS